MRNILVIGATGQIGSELTMELRKRYGNLHVVAGYIPGAAPDGDLKESGPAEIVDVTEVHTIESVVKKYTIDTIYNLAALLSVVAESKPALAWKIGIVRFVECARSRTCLSLAVFTPSPSALRTRNTACHDTAGHHPAPAYHVRCHQVTTELLMILF
jgi:dTDP-4-dehydrorhamnose reductase